MPDTARTRSALQALLADNLVEAISAQDLRDFLASVNLIDEVGLPAQELLAGPGLDIDITWNSADGTSATSDGSPVEDSLTIPFLLASGAPLGIQVGREAYMIGDDFAVSVVGSTTVITFVDTAIPITGTKVKVTATPA